MKDYLKALGIGAIYALFMLIGFVMVVLSIDLYMANLYEYSHLQNFLLGIMGVSGALIFYKATDIK